MHDRPPPPLDVRSAAAGPPPPGAAAAEPGPRGWTGWLGLPRFQWTLTLVGLCLYTFVIVTYYVRIAEVGIAIAAVGLMYRLRTVRLPFPVVIYGGFVLWTFIASLASPYSDIALDKALDLLKLLAIMIIVVNAFQTEGQLRFYLLFFLGCFVLFPVRGTLIGDDNRAGRVVWNYIYNNPNDLATLCLIALGIALGFVFAGKTRLVQLGAFASAMLLVIIIILTQSRGAFFGLVVGMGPALLWVGLKRPGRLALGGLVVALVIGFAVPTTAWERLTGLTSATTIEEVDPEGSAAQRYEIQGVAWRIFLDHPLFGIGLGAYPIANATYAPHIGRMDTHNTYLNLAAEVGFPGFLLWCALAFLVLRFAYRARKACGQTPLAIHQAWIERALWAYLAAGLFGSYAKLTFPYLLLAVLWSSATLLTAERNRADGVAPRSDP